MRYIRGMDELTRDHGPQPLDSLMDRWNLTNHELVEVSEEQLNHKQVQKARKGRKLTLNLMQKLMRAVNEAVLHKLPKEQKAAFVLICTSICSITPRAMTPPGWTLTKS